MISLMLWGVSVILITQTIWLLPKLIERAEQIIQGHEPSSSLVHVFYIFFEVVKFVLLIVLSFKARAADELS